MKLYWFLCIHIGVEFEFVDSGYVMIIARNIGNKVRVIEIREI